MGKQILTNFSNNDINAKAFSKASVSTNTYTNNLRAMPWTRFLTHKTPLPLNQNRKDFGSLCALLSGHSRLQIHVFIKSYSHTLMPLLEG